MVSSVLTFFGDMLAFCGAVAFVAFTIVQEHGGRFLSSGMLLWHMHRPCAYVLFAMYSKLC